MVKRYGKEAVEENIVNGLSQATGEERQWVTAQGLTLLNPEITVSESDKVRLKIRTLDCPDMVRRDAWANGFFTQ
jgi:hypothetical protein